MSQSIPGLMPNRPLTDLKLSPGNPFPGLISPGPIPVPGPIC